MGLAPPKQLQLQPLGLMDMVAKVLAQVLLRPEVVGQQVVRRQQLPQLLLQVVMLMVVRQPLRVHQQLEDMEMVDKQVARQQLLQRLRPVVTGMVVRELVRLQVLRPVQVDMVTKQPNFQTQWQGPRQDSVKLPVWREQHLRQWREQCRGLSLVRQVLML